MNAEQLGGRTLEGARRGNSAEERWRSSEMNGRTRVSKYLIQNNKYLIPINENIQVEDSTSWMKINEIKNENWR